MIMFVLSGTNGYAAPDDKPLLLEVVINGRSTGQVSDFIERDGVLYATRLDIHTFGILTGNTTGRDDELLAMAKLPGVTLRIDGPSQTLQVTATDIALKPTALALSESLASVPVTSGYGAVLNYDLSENYGGGANTLRGLVDGRGFTPAGVLSNQYLAGLGIGAGGVRLNTQYSYSDPATLRQYVAGDIINSGLSWTRPVRLGGIQVDTNFGIRPDLVTSPTPQISGTTAVPSTVDVLVNDVHQLSRDVSPGPFAVTQLPTVDGAGTVTLLMQNALGQQTSQTLPFYATSSLLAPGLSSYSAEIGALRRDFGLRSDAYSTPVLSATARYGALRYLTAEFHGEGTSGGLAMAGAGLTANIANYGLLSAAGAGSISGGPGVLWSLKLERNARRLSLSASIQQTTPGFRDVAAIGGDPVPRRQVRGSASVPLGRFGAIALSYTLLDQRAQLVPGSGALLYSADGNIDPSRQATSTAAPTFTKLLSVSYTVPIYRNIVAYATGFRDFAAGGSTGLLIGITAPFGARRSASASAFSTGSQNNFTEEATQSAPEIGQVGGMVYNQNGAVSRQVALGEYDASFAHLDVGADRTGMTTTLRGDASGSLAFAEGRLFTANSIPDSFAIVDTTLPHVGVFAENRPVGTTDSTGKLLLPNLRAFTENHVEIDPSAIPADSDLVSAVAVVRPQDRSGVVVKFAIKSNKGAIIHLVDAAGAPLQLGSSVMLAPHGVANVVGYDGIAFVRNLDRRNILLITQPDGRKCKAAFTFKRQPGFVPDVGKVACINEPVRP